MAEKHEVEGVDPEDFGSAARFKAAVYRELNAAGSWMDDITLSYMWRKANDKPIPEYMDKLFSDS